jgi:hypothetical protein
VDHIVFGPARLSPTELDDRAVGLSPMPHDPATGLAVWLVDEPATER